MRALGASPASPSSPPFAAACSAGGGAAPSAAAAARASAADRRGARRRRPSRRPRRPTPAPETPDAQDRRQAHDRRRQPGLPAVLRAVRHATPSRGSSATRPTARASRARSRFAIAEELGFAKDDVDLDLAPFNNAIAPGPKDFDIYITQVSYSPERAQAVDLSATATTTSTQSLVVPAKDSKFAKVTTIADLKDCKLGAQVGTTSLKTITDVVAPTKEPKVYDSNDAAVAALQNGQIDGLRRRPPDRVLRHGRPARATAIIVGQFADPRPSEHFSVAAGQGQPADRVRERRDRPAGRGRDPRRARHAVAARPGERSRSSSPDPWARMRPRWRARTVPPRRPRGPRFGLGAEGARSLAIAGLSTVVLFGVIGYVVVNAPGWPRFQESFLNGPIFWESLPKLIAKFWVNVRLFLIAEALILVFGLVLAVLRSLSGPVLFPLRLIATVYVDVFRAIPGLLIIFLLGLGIPALRIPGVPNDEFLWAVGRADAGVLGLRVGGLPIGHRLDPPEPGGGRAVARPVALAGPPLRRAAAGRAAGGPAAAQRLHRPPEGHGAGVVDRRGRGLPGDPDPPAGHVQLHALHRDGADLPRGHDPARPPHGLAARAREGQAAGGAGTRAMEQPGMRGVGGVG